MILFKNVVKVVFNVPLSAFQFSTTMGVWLVPFGGFSHIPEISIHRMGRLCKVAAILQIQKKDTVMKRTVLLNSKWKVKFFIPFIPTCILSKFPIEKIIKKKHAEKSFDKKAPMTCCTKTKKGQYDKRFDLGFFHQTFPESFFKHNFSLELRRHLNF